MKKSVWHKVRIPLKTILTLSSEPLYLNQKRQPPTRWVDQLMGRNTTPSLAKVLGWFFYVDLLTKRKNECKQCQKENTESQYILKIETIFHRHHLHPVKNRRSAHPATRLPCCYTIINGEIRQ